MSSRETTRAFVRERSALSPRSATPTPTLIRRPREERRDDVFGVRSFYMKAIVVDPYDTGPVVLKNAQDYAWVTKDDLAEFIPDEEYRTFLGYIL